MACTQNAVMYTTARYDPCISASRAQMTEPGLRYTSTTRAVQPPVITLVPNSIWLLSKADTWEGNNEVSAA